MPAGAADTHTCVTHSYTDGGSPSLSRETKSRNRPAAAAHRAPLSQLVPVVLGATVLDDSSKVGKLLSGVTTGRVEAMVMDSCASRVMEVLMAVAHKVGARGGSE